MQDCESEIDCNDRGTGVLDEQSQECVCRCEAAFEGSRCEVDQCASFSSSCEECLGQPAFLSCVWSETSSVCFHSSTSGSETCSADYSSATGYFVAGALIIGMAVCYLRRRMGSGAPGPDGGGAGVGRYQPVREQQMSPLHGASAATDDWEWDEEEAAWDEETRGASRGSASGGIGGASSSVTRITAGIAPRTAPGKGRAAGAPRAQGAMSSLKSRPSRSRARNPDDIFSSLGMEAKPTLKAPVSPGAGRRPAEDVLSSAPSGWEMDDEFLGDD